MSQHEGCRLAAGGQSNAADRSEFEVPKDRKQPASKYVYPRGTFRLVALDGVTRPVPTTAAAPVATLHPL